MALNLKTIPALYFLTMIPLAYFPPGASCWRGLASQASPQMPHLPPITSHWCWKITSFDQGSSINDVSLFLIHLTSPYSRFSDINLSYCRHKVFYPIIFRLWRHLWTTHYADCDSQKFNFWKIKTFGNQNHYAEPLQPCFSTGVSPNDFKFLEHFFLKSVEISM